MNLSENPEFFFIMVFTEFLKNEKTMVRRVDLPQGKRGLSFNTSLRAAQFPGRMGFATKSVRLSRRRSPSASPPTPSPPQTGIRLCTKPCSIISRGRSRPMNTMTLWRDSPSPQSAPALAPINSCTPWTMIRYGKPDTANTPL